MYENIFIIIFGILFILFGISNYKGNINSIHWYHRTRITEETKRPYGKIMGISTIIIGVGLLIPGLLMLFFENNNFEYITIISLIIGLSLMIYGQFKYNKGLF